MYCAQLTDYDEEDACTDAHDEDLTLPSRNLVSQTGAQSCLQEEAIDAADVVVIAVPKDFYSSLPLKRLAGKVVVDVSNRSTIHNKMTM